VGENVEKARNKANENALHKPKKGV